MPFLHKTLSLLLTITLLTTPLLAVHAQAVQSVQLESLQEATMASIRSSIGSDITPLESYSETRSGDLQSDTRNTRFQIYGNGQTIQVGQSATVRAGFYTPHASCIVTEEDPYGNTLRSSTYTNVAGNGAYITYTSSRFTTPGVYSIRYHCPDTNTHAYDDVFTIYVVSATPAPTPTIRPTTTPSSSIRPTQTPSPTPTPLPTASDDYANTSLGAYALSDRSEITAKINYAGDIDFFTYTAITSGSHTFRSTGISDMYGYLLHAQGQTLASNDDSEGSLNFKITYTLTAGQVYHLKVKHYSSSQTGAYGLRIESPNIDRQPPTIPTNLRAETIGKTSLMLSWDASTDDVGVTGYDIYQNDQRITTIPGNMYTVTGLTSNTKYRYHVRAVDAAGNVSGNSLTLEQATQPDWYIYSQVDAQGITTDFYLSELGGSIEGKTSPIQAIAKRSDEQYYTELVYRNDTWVKTGTTWTYNPITTPYSSYGKKLVIPPSIIPMKAWMEDGVKRGMSTLYSMVGMTPEELTEENKQKIKHGILASFDDNV